MTTAVGFTIGISLSGSAQALDVKYLHTIRTDTCIADWESTNPEKNVDEKSVAGFVAVLGNLALNAVASYVFDKAVDAITPDQKPIDLSTTEHEAYLFRRVERGTEVPAYILKASDGFGCFTTIMDEKKLPEGMRSYLSLDEANKLGEVKHETRIEQLKAAGFRWKGSGEPGQKATRLPSLIFEARVVPSDDGTGLYLQAVYYWQQRWHKDLPAWKDGKISLLKDESVGTRGMTLIYKISGTETAPYLTAAFDFGKVEIERVNKKVVSTKLRGKSRRNSAFSKQDLANLQGMRTAWLTPLSVSKPVATKFLEDIKPFSVAKEDSKEAALTLSIKEEEKKQIERDLSNAEEVLALINADPGSTPLRRKMASHVVDAAKIKLENVEIQVGIWVKKMGNAEAALKSIQNDLGKTPEGQDHRYYMPVSVHTEVRLEPDPDKTLIAISSALSSNKEAILEEVVGQLTPDDEADELVKEIATQEKAIKGLSLRLAGLSLKPEENAAEIAELKMDIADAQISLAGQYSRLVELSS